MRAEPRAAPHHPSRGEGHRSSRRDRRGLGRADPAQPLCSFWLQKAIPFAGATEGHLHAQASPGKTGLTCQLKGEERGWTLGVVLALPQQTVTLAFSTNILSEWELRDQMDTLDSEVKSDLL